MTSTRGMFVCGSQARRPQQQQRSYHEQQPRQTQAAAAAPEYADAAIVVSFVYAGLKQPTRVSPGDSINAALVQARAPELGGGVCRLALRPQIQKKYELTFPLNWRA